MKTISLPSAAAHRSQSCSAWPPLGRLRRTFSSLLISPRQTNQNTCKHRLQSSPQPRRLRFITGLCREAATAAALCPRRSVSANGMRGTKDAQWPMLTAVPLHSASLQLEKKKKEKPQCCAWRTNRLKNIQDKLMMPFDPFQGNDFMIKLHKTLFSCLDRAHRARTVTTPATPVHYKKNRSPNSAQKRLECSGACYRLISCV